MKLMIALFSLFSSIGILADELPKFDTLNVGTKTYRVVKVTAIEPSGIRFTHESGAARAKFEELDAETRAKFTFDPEKAKEFEADRERKIKMAALTAQEAKLSDELIKGAKKAMVRIEGTVQQVTERGVLLSDAKVGKEHDVAVQNYLGAWYKQVDWTTLPDGAAFVVCSTRGIVDGHSIDEILYPRGSYEFTTVLGARRKVKCYTASLSDYLGWLRDPNYQPK